VVYGSTTRPRDRAGIYAFWSFIALLVLMYLANLFGPPPPSVKAIALAGLGLWVFVAWAYWLDRHRQVRPQSSGGMNT
jgi:polyferredoxin